MFAITHFIIIILLLAILYYMGVFDDLKLAMDLLNMHSSIADQYSVLSHFWKLF